MEIKVILGSPYDKNDFVDILIILKKFHVIIFFSFNIFSFFTVSHYSPSGSPGTPLNIAQHYPPNSSLPPWGHHNYAGDPTLRRVATVPEASLPVSHAPPHVPTRMVTNPNVNRYYTKIKIKF